MIEVAKTLVGQLVRCTRSRAALQLENALLRHQIEILRRRPPRRIKVSRLDRLIFKLAMKLSRRSIRFIHIVHPKTVIRWHRESFRLYWRWKSRRLGRPRMSGEIRSLIRRMADENPLWGAPRIHGEMLKLGFCVSQATVYRYMQRRPSHPGQTWKTFIRNHLDCTAAIDFLVVPTLSLRVLYIVVILRLDRRELVHLAVTANPTAEWTAQQVTEAFPWNEAPSFLIRDQDRTYGSVYRDRLAVMGIADTPTAPRSPWQNAYVERVIGSIRRECLDHVIVKDERHLDRVLRQYMAYYNRSRTHLSLNKDPPVPRTVSSRKSGPIITFPEVGGLHHRYERVAA